MNPQLHWLAGLAWLTAMALPAAPSPTTNNLVRFPWPEGRRAALSLSFDDARLSQVDAGLGWLASQGVKATFYVSPGNVGKRLEGWKKAVAAGHEIGNHSLNHPCTGNFPWSRDKALEDYTIGQMRQELRDATQLIESMLGVSPQTFGYPCGQKLLGREGGSQSYVPLVAHQFLAGRGFLDETANDPAYGDLAQLLGVSSDNRSFEQFLPLLTQAVERGGWLVLAGHEMGNTNQFQTTRLDVLEAVLAYARDPAHPLWIDTVQAVATYVAGQRGEEVQRPRPDYQDALLPTERRMEDLLGRMTLEEKVGQLNMPCVYAGELGGSDAAKREACRKFAAGKWVPGIGPAGGFFTLANTILHQGPRQQAGFFNELQRIAARETRLKIPLLQTEEGTHGLMCSGGTIFPEGLALGSTWNPALLRQIYAAAAREARAVGIHQLFTLVVEPNRDPRLGRNQEGYSEDPYLCARIAEAIVQGAQGDQVSAPDKVVAGLCHYPGQSQPLSGLERGAMEISERTLREVFLPPWVAGIRRHGALGVMATYPAIDGVPAHASDFILGRILRQELGFDGLVLSEGSGISTLLYEGLADSEQAAGELALRAGVDVGISHERAYLQDLAQSVREGRTPMELVDRSVRRVLKQKFRLGLFENPLADERRARAVSHATNHVALALQAAREGIVLLKNAGGLLPLKTNLASLAVIGPNADHPLNQLGDYTALKILQPVVTVLAGLKAAVSPQTQVTYVQGCAVTGSEVNEIEQARIAARAAEVAVVVVGENEWRAPGKKGTDGEGYDVATLELTGLQEQLIQAVHETGTPTVVVLINGRPLATRWVSAQVPALVEAWIGGELGGQAVADVLFGACNPSGRLTITVPRHAGQLPVYYNSKPSKNYWVNHGWGKPYADLDPEPLYEFGFGLSYTQFEYRQLKISPARTGPGGRLTITCQVANTGSRAGTEVAQLYLRSAVSTMVAPVMQLRGFARLALKPGETREAQFTLGPDELALLDRHLNWVVEPGKFEVMVGASSKDIRLRGSFEVAMKP